MSYLFERLCQRFFQPALYFPQSAAGVLAARFLAEGCFQADEATLRDNRPKEREKLQKRFLKIVIKC